MAIIALSVGAWFAAKEFQRVGIPTKAVLLVLAYSFIPAIFFGKLFHLILFGGLHVYIDSPIKILCFWQRISIQGFQVGGFLTAILIYKRFKVSYWKFSDAIMPLPILAQAIGKLGCFLNGCCYGRPTNLPWGVVFAPNSWAGFLSQGQPIHPTQLYSAFTNFIIFFILWKMRKRAKFDGFVTCLYMILWSSTRFMIEFLRADYERIPHINLDPPQIVCLAALFLGLGLFRYLSNKHQSSLNKT